MEITLLEWCVISLHPYASKEESMASYKRRFFRRGFQRLCFGLRAFLHTYTWAHNLLWGGGSVFWMYEFLFFMSVWETCVSNEISKFNKKKFSKKISNLFFKNPLKIKKSLKFLELSSKVK